MGRGNRPGHGRPGGRNFSVKRRRMNVDITQKQKSHLKQFGEAHPVDDGDSLPSHKYKIIKDVEFQQPRPGIRPGKTVAAIAANASSDDEPEKNVYMDLLSSLGVKHAEAEDSSSSGSEDIDLSDDTDVELNDNDDDDENDDEVAEQSSDDVAEDIENGDGKCDTELPIEYDLNCSAANDDEEARDMVIEETVLNESDPFRVHFDIVLPDSFTTSLIDKIVKRCQETLIVPHLNRVDASQPTDCSLKPRKMQFTERDVRQLHVKQTLCNQLAVANLKFAGVQLSGNDCWTSLQQSVFACINSYQDFYCPVRSYRHGEELRLAYCLHALNHVLKTRSRIMIHNSKIRNRNDEVPDEFRDKGFTRPKVLILLPFRDSALRVVNIMSELLADKQSFVSTQKKFFSEYSKREDNVTPNGEHEDLETVFAGNTNECFTLGLGIAKKTLKLYTKFADSDIILASPLGLWGVTEEKKVGQEAGGEYDFMSSIEIMIVDQADILLMQNWDHVLSLFERVNRQPVCPTGIDFSRVRMWTLNGWSKFYRQTIMFSEFDVLPLKSAFMACCSNYAGRLLVRSMPTGIWCRIFVRVRHEFCRFSVDSAKLVDDQRFDYFTSQLLSIYSDGAMSKTLVFLSSSFDFIRLRNHLMRRRIEFVTLSEYDEADKMKRARSDFVNEDRVQLMLITERFLFYRRRELQKITGIRHLLFYDLPTRPQFYADVCNWVRDVRPRYRHNEDSASCRVLYCKYDIQRLRAVLGSERADIVQAALRDKSKCVLEPPMLEG